MFEVLGWFISGSARGADHLRPITGIGGIVRKFLLSLVGMVAIFIPVASHAQVTAKDIQVAARVLNFTATPFTGTVKLGIVYDPAVAASAADEQALTGLLGSGLTVGSINLVPVPVPIAKLASTPVDVLFLTSGLGTAGAAVATQAASAKTLCITTDLSATQAGNCAVSVQSDPKVQITVNKAAASASGVSFASAFLMMVTEI
jgi:hypothetical protein